MRNPDAFQPDLAGSLNSLGTTLLDLGQREAALAAIREAEQLCSQARFIEQTTHHPVSPR
jgi:hypothetical protein